MFSVASGKYYADKHGLDYALLRNTGHNNFLKIVEKTIFKNIKIVDSINRSDYEVIEERSFYDPIIRKQKRDIFLNGYRESPRYWDNDKDYVLSIFKPEEGQIEKIKETYSDIDFPKFICINVRRGDYLAKDVRRRIGLLSTQYFYNCISKFPSDQKFLIVSDDIEWCKLEFFDINCVFADRVVEGFDKITTDLWLQTLCGGNIISNSTFSWWGAYLNTTPHRKVYYPSPFFRSVNNLMEKIPANDNWILVPAVWDNNTESPRLEDLIVKRTQKLLGIPINVKNPLTIQDKLAWLKINDVTPLKTKCADKILLHDYVKEKIGKDICIPIIATYKSPEEIDWSSLPNSFVIKCNHGSGMNIIVKDKKNINKSEIKSKLSVWLNTNFALQNCYEMHYADIERRILIEEYKADEKQKDSLLDYKFWCFNGEPMLYTINDGVGHGKIMYYNMDGTPNDLYGNKSKKREKPKNFELMCDYAKTLSSDFKFVRVDFYEVNNIVYLGELTFIPGAGLFKYKDRETDILVGNMLKLSNNKKVIYTCITGDYDVLLDPECSIPGYDFICFTDNPTAIKSNIWQAMQIPSELSKLTNQKKQRYIKINPHKFLQKYDISIYVDANVNILENPNELLQSCKGVVNIPKHPTRNCIYQEFLACQRAKKDTIENMKPQIERYEKEGFPKNYGLTQNNIIIRKHNDPECIKLMEAWWEEVKNGSYRDQLSLFYVKWKTNVNIYILDKSLQNSKYFKWRMFHSNNEATKNLQRLTTANKENYYSDIISSRRSKFLKNLMIFRH